MQHLSGFRNNDRGQDLSISEIRSGLNSRPSQSWTVMVEAKNLELPPVETWS